MPILVTPLQERVLAHAERHGDCLLFTGAVNPAGYGVIGVGPRGAGTALAHRVAWAFAHGPIPDGIEVDHTCLVRNCIEVSHLQLVTPQRNKELAKERRAACRRGLHPIPATETRCRPCHAEYMRNYRKARA